MTTTATTAVNRKEERALREADAILSRIEELTDQLKWAKFPPLEVIAVDEDGNEVAANTPGAEFGFRCPRCGNVVGEYELDEIDFSIRENDVDEVLDRVSQFTYSAHITEGDRYYETLYFRHGGPKGHGVSLPEGVVASWS